MARFPLIGTGMLLVASACAPPSNQPVERFNVGSCRAPTARPSEPDTVIYDARDVDRRPEVAQVAIPVYPPALKARGVGGKATVVAVIDTLGHAEPDSTRVTVASDSAFGSAALAAVRASRWCSGIRDGHRVRVRITIPFHWAVSGAP